VPLRLIAAVLLADELLWMVSRPGTAPAVVGSNSTSSVSAKFGFKVTGNVAPEIANPIPINVAELMVTGPVPVELNVTGWVVGVFTGTLPNATLLGLTDNMGTVAAGAFKCITKLLEGVPDVLAVSVTVCADVTDPTRAVKPPLVAFAGIASVAGTLTAALLLANRTVTPTLPAAAARVTVQLSLPDPMMDALLQESETTEMPRLRVT
jgi:hypothetical protein